MEIKESVRVKNIVVVVAFSIYLFGFIKIRKLVKNGIKFLISVLEN